MPAIRMLFNHLLEYNDSIPIYGIPKEAPEMVASWILHFHKKRVGLKISMPHIYNEDAKERRDFLNKMEYTEARYLPKEYNSPVSTIICGDEVLLVHWFGGPLTVQIINKKIADSYKKYFDIIWALATK